MAEIVNLPNVNADVNGPATSTDNAVTRFNGTDGYNVQDSAVLISDTNEVSGITALSVDNITVDGNTITSTNTNGNVVVDPNGTGQVVITGARLYGTAIHNNAEAITGTTNQYIASGTYTPTLSNTTNVDASTALNGILHYVRFPTNGEGCRPCSCRTHSNTNSQRHRSDCRFHRNSRCSSFRRFAGICCSSSWCSSH